MVNGTIGKQMVDTLVESASNVEVRIPNFERRLWEIRNRTRGLIMFFRYQNREYNLFFVFFRYQNKEYNFPELALKGKIKELYIFFIKPKRASHFGKVSQFDIR